MRNEMKKMMKQVRKKKILSLVLVLMIIVSNVAYANPFGVNLNERFAHTNERNIVFSHADFYGEFADFYLNGELVDKGLDYKNDAFPKYITTNSDVAYISSKYLTELGIKTTYNKNRLDLSLNSSDVELEVNDEFSMLEKSEVLYKNQLEVNIPFAEVEDAYVVDSNNQKIEGLEIEKNYKKLLIKNTYHLNIGESFTIVMIKDNNIIKKEIEIMDNISLESFSQRSSYPMDLHYLVMPINKEEGFHHPYIIQFPDKERTTIEDDFNSTFNTVMVDTDNSGVTPRNDFQYYKAIGSDFAYSIMNDLSAKYYDKYNKSFIGIYTIFPRIGNGVYTHALDRESIFLSKNALDDYDRGNIYRLDIQHKEMIEDGQRYIKQLGKNVDEQVILTGFSASADFATRFNYLHPDIAKAVIVNASPTLPLTKYKGETLRYPLGMGDIHQITGEKFDLDKFKDTPQFWLTGKHDTNDGTYMYDGWGDYGSYKNHPNQEGRDYRRLFGKDIRERKDDIMDILQSKGINNIEYHKYNTGHDWNEDEIYSDIFKFIKKHNLDEYSESRVSSQVDSGNEIIDDEIIPLSNQKDIGEKIGDVLHTDIRTYFNNEEIESFNINGSTAIYVSSLKKLGLNVEWDAELRKVIISK